jgi:hypothetical protein
MNHNSDKPDEEMTADALSEILKHAKAGEAAAIEELLRNEAEAWEALRPKRKDKPEDAQREE